ncbi:Protein FAM161A [Frankliniella fusca]|uniref:Protein FAM161A n=1 Tax=Frankliniella fusca TaxID=407009 RepID=A0AAE1HI95_9NEOP|nr:Protein FAM161A [Frankliniella fusca]
MTRKHAALSYSSSCLRVPVNPYSQQPSPSYERRQVATPHTEDESSLSRKLCQMNTSSRPSSSLRSPSIRCKKPHGKTNKDGSQSSDNSPLGSFLDFYESIPDYQDITHLSDKEFEEKLKLLRDKQRQYLHTLSDRYSPIDYECRAGQSENCKKKTFKSLNKFDLAKEWVNKSCDSMSLLSKKSDGDFRVRSSEVDEEMMKKASSSRDSPRKDDTGRLLVETGSSLSTDSNMLKMKTLGSTFAVDGEQKTNTTNSGQGCSTLFLSGRRSESCQEFPNYYSTKDRPISSYEFYIPKETTSGSQPSTSKRKIRPSSGLHSSGTSDLNGRDCSSSLGNARHDVRHYEDFYVPTQGWMQSDSDSMLGTIHHIPSTHQPNPKLKQNPKTKRANLSETGSTKKRTRRKRRGSKSVTKPVPFSFMSNDRLYSRSTPDLSSHCRSPSPKHFRARPIPRNLFSNYIYQKKQEDEFFRALKRKVRAEEMLRAASLPPSMEFRERLGRVQAEAAVAAGAGPASSSSEQSGPAGAGAGAGAGVETGARERTTAGVQSASSSSSSRCRGGRGRSRRGRPRRPPDFTKCHDKMRQELYERQARNITTSPSPYSLRTASLSPRRKKAGNTADCGLKRHTPFCFQCFQGSASSGSDTRRCRPRPRSSTGTGMDACGSATSRSNLAALLRIQSARQRLEAEHHRLREEQQRRAELRLKERLTRLTPAWRSIQYSTEEDLALRAAARRQEERERRREHGQLMRHMLHRVHTIPTLFERQSGSASARRLMCSVDLCDIASPEDEDEDAADVEVFDAREVRRVPRPSRARQRERPSSAGAGAGASSGSGRRSACSVSASMSPDKLQGRGRRHGSPVAAALRSPDRQSERLRSYQRQLLRRAPHRESREHRARVEFSDSPALSLSAHGEDQDGAAGAGAGAEAGTASRLDGAEGEES